MQFTRDSVLWTLGILGALVAYLLSAPAPTQWDYHQCLQFIAAVVAVVSAKLGTSPLLSSEDAGRVSLPKAAILVPFLLGLTAVSLMGCAHNQAPTVSPTTANAQRALQVVKALDVVRDTAVSLNASTPPILSSADLQIVVRIHEAAIKVIDAVPSGWKPTVLASLDELQKDLPAASYQRIAIYVDAARIAIADFAPGDLTPHQIPPAQIAAEVAEDDGYRALDALPEMR